MKYQALKVVFSTSEPRSHRWAGAMVGAGVAAVLGATAGAEDVSLPVIFHHFEATYDLQVNRTADIFLAGYGSIWVPPSGRASTGSGSVGYDPYDRFDLGRWDDPTLHGTERGLRAFADKFERAGGAVIVDLVWNHNGFQYDDTPGFLESGGYPGLVTRNPSGNGDPQGVPGTNGDFHSPFAGGFDARFIGLIDIAHESNHQLIRNPVDPADPLNIAPGFQPFNGRIANTPTPENARFYPDRDLDPILVYNPATGQQDIAIYPFNTSDPTAGDAVPENGLGYLMRNARWLVQDVGVEGYRLDIPWHFGEFVQDYFDQAVYRASNRTNLDGSQYQVFSFMEAGTGNQNALLDRFVRKNIDPSDPGRIGSNYDALDFNFYHSVADNLTGNGFQNDWRSVVTQSLDKTDDGLMNGSAGIKFVASHDDVAPQLSNVAHAYMLLLPGQATVYLNAKQHGGDLRDFPRGSRGDALGGVYGDTLTELVDIRTTHGRGDFRERVLEKETYVFERSGAALVGLSNRLDGGFTERRVDVDLPYGTFLVELTGNSQLSGDIPDLVRVDDDFFEGPTKATIRVPHNDGGDAGYVIYGLATPQSQDGIELSQAGDVPVTVLAGETPPANDFDNGRTRLADLHVITEDQFTLRVQTQPVTLSGTQLVNGEIINVTQRDVFADGDNAVFRVDGGLDLNGINPAATVSGVDFDQPGSVVYGFEQFNTVSDPGYKSDGSGSGFGDYQQVIDTSALSEGEHFLTARVFRHRSDGGPAVFDELKKVIYVDRLDPLAGVSELKAVNAAGSGDHDIIFESLDSTASTMNAFVNLPAALSDQEVLDLAFADQGQAEQVDVGLFKRYFAGLPEGNNVFTVVTVEPTGRYNVQRFAGQILGPGEGRGAGFGDLNHNGLLQPDDIAFTDHSFERVYYSQNTEFNPAADLNGDGLVDYLDLAGYRDGLIASGASAGVVVQFDALLSRRGDFDGSRIADSADIDELFTRFGNTDWFSDLDGSGVVDLADVQALVNTVFLTQMGDADLDGMIGQADLDTVLLNWGRTDGLWATGDYNGDRFVGQSDLDMVLLNWGGQDSPAVASRAIPEPGTSALLAGTGLWLLSRRKRQAGPNR